MDFISWIRKTFLEESDGLKPPLHPNILVENAKILRSYLEPKDALSLASTNRFANRHKYSFLIELHIEEDLIDFITLPEVSNLRTIKIFRDPLKKLGIKPRISLRDVLEFRTPNQKLILPFNLTTLHFVNNPNVGRLIVNLSVNKVIIGYRCDLPNFNFICFLLPITNLVLGDTYNSSVCHVPKSITHLTIGYAFDGSVDHLPESLLELVLGDAFNSDVDHLPQTLTHLTFGKKFNKAVDHLPPNLTHLVLGHDFNKPIDHLPKTLSHLELGDIFNQAFNHLPKSLRYLKLGCEFDREINSYSEEMLESHLLTFSCNLKSLNLTHLIFSGTFNKKIDSSNLPSTLTHLTLGQFFNQDISDLPDSLTNLTFANECFHRNDIHSNSFNKPISSLPQLKFLSLGSKFNQPLDFLPNSITHLVLGRSFNQPIDNLPSSLAILDIHEHCAIKIHMIGYATRKNVWIRTVRDPPKNPRLGFF